MQAGKNPARALTQHPTFIFTYLFPPISCTHKLLQLITARENHSCHAPTPWTPTSYQEARRQPPGQTQAAPGPQQPPPHPWSPHAHPTLPGERRQALALPRRPRRPRRPREPLPWLRLSPKDLSTCLLHDSSLGATGRRNNENWMRLGFWFFK